MVTGEEHYTEAERLLKAATDFMEAQAPQIKTLQQQDVMQQGVVHLIARAQVHATLALVAAQSPPSVRVRFRD